MKRTPLQRKTPLARSTRMAVVMPKQSGLSGRAAPRRTRVKPMSAKRIQDAQVRRTVVAALLAAAPICQARWKCYGAPATEVHERLKRSRGGSITDPAHGHMVTICRTCHEATEAEVAEATRRRLLLPSWHQCPPAGPC